MLWKDAIFTPFSLLSSCRPNNSPTPLGPHNLQFQSPHPQSKMVVTLGWGFLNNQHYVFSTNFFAPGTFAKAQTSPKSFCLRTEERGHRSSEPRQAWNQFQSRFQIVEVSGFFVVGVNVCWESAKVNLCPSFNWKKKVTSSDCTPLRKIPFQEWKKMQIEWKLT